ncbi:MAG TPA: amino acid adenylation domain-containing protein [Pyrinomonadaceae bacterium]|nr:amino acid adenylation domain-containing protein [Pyrinomonadaceae bacterium]
MSNTNLQFLDEPLGAEKDYWMRKLSGCVSHSLVPFDFKRPRVFDPAVDVVHLDIAPDVQEQLRKVCQSKEPLIFTVLVTALKVCLHKYTGIPDVVVGTPIYEGYREMSSLNKVLALRDEVNPDSTLRQLLQAVKTTISEAYANQKYPFERILNLLHIESPENQEPLFSSMVFWDSSDNRANTAHLKHDISVVCSLHPESSRLGVTLEYRPYLYQKRTIEVLGEYLQRVLRAILYAPDTQIGELDMLSPEKRQELLFDFNHTSKDYPRKPVHVLFEEQVERTPAAVAVRFMEHSLTYEQLNSRANRLAHYLQDLGVKPGVLVGICMGYSLDTLVGLLGVLKSGGAYVPLDPFYPLDHLAFMLEDSAVPILLTEQSMLDHLPPHQGYTICLDADAALFASFSTLNPDSSSLSSSLPAYLIYTSGSTGRPKAVIIPHSALVNYISWAIDFYLRQRPLVAALYSSLSFDLTVTSIFVPLLSGNSLVAYRKSASDSPLLDIIRENQVDLLKLTPSHLTLIKDLDLRHSRLRCLIVGGEALETELAARISDCFGGDIDIYNEYGPTEATVGCMIYRYDRTRDVRAGVPIGRPIANTEIYLLDERRRAVGEEMWGELYVAGAGLADGYLHQEEMTARRFVAHVLRPGERMYRTGDVARRLSSGEMEYVGRGDEQVKYHGYRVELAEISAALNKHPQVRDSVVRLLRDERGDEVLVGYYVSRQELDGGELREFLEQEMIRETIPGLLVHLKKMPLTMNGKINYEELPGVEEARGRVRKEKVGARTTTEEIVGGIYEEVLGVKGVSMQESFFELGGHSLLATQVVSRVREVFGVEVGLREVFGKPTVAGLSTYIDELLQAEQEEIKKIQQVLENLEKLSEEEVRVLLDKNENSEDA